MMSPGYLLAVPLHSSDLLHMHARTVGYKIMLVLLVQYETYAHSCRHVSHLPKIPKPVIRVHVKPHSYTSVPFISMVKSLNRPSATIKMQYSFSSYVYSCSDLTDFCLNNHTIKGDDNIYVIFHAQTEKNVCDIFYNTNNLKCFIFLHSSLFLTIIMKGYSRQIYRYIYIYITCFMEVRRSLLCWCVCGFRWDVKKIKSLLIIMVVKKGESGSKHVYSFSFIMWDAFLYSPSSSPCLSHKGKRCSCSR